MATIRVTQANFTVRPKIVVPRRCAVARPNTRSLVIANAEPAQETKSPVETAIEQAKSTCDSGTTQECAAAWDEVEELAANASHRKSQKQTDPLEEYCDDNPEADECRVYED